MFARLLYKLWQGRGGGGARGEGLTPDHVDLPVERSAGVVGAGLQHGRHLRPLIHT